MMDRLEVGLRKGGEDAILALSSAKNDIDGEYYQIGKGEGSTSRSKKRRNKLFLFASCEPLNLDFF